MTERIRDIDIRKKLHDDFSLEFANDPDTLILDEFSLLQGETRVDIVVVNGQIHGYEIKSDKDTLERLPKQVALYSKVLDTVTVITGERYAEKVLKIIPEWWGMKVARASKNLIRLENVRMPQNNPEIDPYSLVQLLWREEALDLLRKYGLERGFLSKSRRVIWTKLAQSIPLEELKYHVRLYLKSRKNWRSD